jgi:hypothetical protein
MIVTSHTKGWKITTQRSHGLLAALLANQYNIDLPNEIFVPTLIAIAEHDDGVAETLASKNLTDAGAPRHFLVDNGSTKTDLKQYVNVMELASAKSELNALLTAMHLDFIFNNRVKGEDKVLDAFLKQLGKDRKVMLKNTALDEDFAAHLYRFVEWCDAFSLLICMDKIQPEGRKMEISESPDGVMSQAFYKKDNVITVEPWPFKNDTFKVFYEYKVVEQLQFKSIEAFNEVYKKTPVARKVFVFAK